MAEVLRPSDALIVVEDWISEHYFTTDAKSESFQARVLARRKEWDAVDEDLATSRSRFSAERARLETDLVALYDETPNGGNSSTDSLQQLYSRIRNTLGYATGEFRVETRGPAHFYGTPGVDGAPLVIIEATPLGALEEFVSRRAETLICPYVPDEKADGEVKSAAALLSRLFVETGGPAFALVQAGRWLIVTDGGHWPEGRYLAIDLQTVAERNDTKRGGEIDKALTCVEAASLAPDADGSIWWGQVLEASVKHTIGVSKDLREGVRRSIEIIANDVVTRRAEAGWQPLAADQAQPLAVQSLRFLYRILFLLYAEASPELGVLPVGAPEYEQGYSLDRLRELVLVDLATQRARSGTHFYASLKVLFDLVDQGSRHGLEFQSLRADLFRPRATALIDEVGLSNLAMQQVLSRLLLSKKVPGKDRGFISYVELGINQLGAVYEGLMSYTGFFANHDLFEVAKDGNAERGSWVVPVERAGGIAAKDFVREEDPDTGELRPVRHARGSFVYRLSGRERQQSASYYTPEALTRFTVGQALEELLDQDGRKTTAEEILAMTVCEPALGSGAFAIEAVRQLGEQYLTRRQAELGATIPPDEYPLELQRVKARLALHQVYGVDLNATAVELAEITLWLDTMVKGLGAPWFGLRLRRGNSLIGARHAIYSRAQVNDKSWLVAPPTDIPLTELARAVEADTTVGAVEGRIHHFLLPAAGWAATTGAKEARQLAPEVTDAVRRWRTSIKAKPTRPQLDLLVELTRRAEVLWQLAFRRLRIAEAESRRDIPLWGHDAERHGNRVTREQIEASLADPDGAFSRLRMIMDAWCALWFWPLHGQDQDPAARVQPPTLDRWIDALQGILGRDPHRLRKINQDTLAAGGDWAALEQAEQDDLAYAQAKPTAQVLSDHPWLWVCADVAKQQGFFHWELDFATVLARGGFDLQVGNPPWVRPDTDVDALLAEGDPWWQLALSPSETMRTVKRAETLRIPHMENLVVSGLADVVAAREFVSHHTLYPLLVGLRPDLYRCFMSQTWNHKSQLGTIGLIHPETHFTDEKAGTLREATYLKLRRHWQFINELMLFEIDDKRDFGVHVYGSRDRVAFDNAAALYHPDTVTRSYDHDGSGTEPGFKTVDGHWDLRPHRSRISRVTHRVLATWHAVLETDRTHISQTRMLYTVNRSVTKVLEVLAEAPRLASVQLHTSTGWNEKGDRERGLFAREWGLPNRWDDVILQGPHLSVNTPFFKSPNRTMLHNQDWSANDLETLKADAVPVTSYKPAGSRLRFDSSYTRWGATGEIAARSYYRLAWRSMAANKNERTLMSALIPPGTSHINGVFSLAYPSDSRILTLIAGAMSTLLADFLVRAAPKSGIYMSVVDRLPLIGRARSGAQSLILRTLRLNCLTEAYADLWRECFHSDFLADAWTDNQDSDNRPPLGDVSPEWTPRTPLRIAADRRQAQVEIDALVALMLGVTADQLCTVYRTQFAVLYGYDHNEYTYDANGRLVPNAVLRVWRTKGDRINEEERTDTNQAGNTYTYELPFGTLDREADMRRAYAEFERRLPAMPKTSSSVSSPITTKE